MRLTRYHLFLLGGLFLMVMGPLAFTQPGPGGSKGGKGGGKGGFDPANIFTLLSGGKDSFDVKTVQLQSWGRGPTPEEQKDAMLVFLQTKGVTNGVMTKDLYVEHFQQRMTEMRAQREAKGKQDGGTPPAPGASPAAPQDVEAEARAQFAMHDTDKNGSLSVEEMQNARMKGSRIFDERDKWDADKNGTIELPEYIEYYKARMARRANGGKGNQNPTPPTTESVKPVEEEKRAVVFRTGKFPKELPAWFEEADKDKDGQVGLYEWKATNKPVRDFLAMDLNGDGFLTVEEVLRYQRATVKATTSATPGSSSSGTTDAAPPQRGRGQGGPGGGRNGGGRNGGAPKGG